MGTRNDSVGNAGTVGFTLPFDLRNGSVAVAMQWDFFILATNFLSGGDRPFALFSWIVAAFVGGTPFQLEKCIQGDEDCDREMEKPVEFYQEVYIKQLKHVGDKNAETLLRAAVAPYLTMKVNRTIFKYYWQRMAGLCAQECDMGPYPKLVPVLLVVLLLCAGCWWLCCRRRKETVEEQQEEE